jgi:hypothetical protein
MSRKKHTQKKKEPKPWCPQPNCATVVEESSTAACSYIGGRSLAVSAADLLGWGNSSPGYKEVPGSFNPKHI